LPMPIAVIPIFKQISSAGKPGENLQPPCISNHGEISYSIRSNFCLRPERFSISLEDRNE
jgi:hypothetical protein